MALANSIRPVLRMILLAVPAIIIGTFAAWLHFRFLDPLGPSPTEEGFDSFTLLVIAIGALNISRVILLRTWHWTYLGRSLLLVFTSFGAVYLASYVWRVTGTAPDLWVRWAFRAPIVAGCILTSHALLIYPWPAKPERIRFAQLLGFERDQAH